MNMMQMVGLMVCCYFVTLVLLAIYRNIINVKVGNAVFIIVDVIFFFFWNYGGYQRRIQILRKRVLRDQAGEFQRMLRAFGGLGLEPAAFLLTLKIIERNACSTGYKCCDAKRYISAN